MCQYSLFFSLLFSTCKSQTTTINAAASVGAAEEFEPLTDVPAPAILLRRCKKKPHQRSSALGSVAIACDSLLEKILLHRQPNSHQKQPCVVLGRAIAELLGTMLADGRCRADGQTTAVLPSSSTGQLRVPRAEPHVLQRALGGFRSCVLHGTWLCHMGNPTWSRIFGKTGIWQCLQWEPKP